MWGRRCAVMKLARISVMALVLLTSSVVARAAEGPSKAVFAYGAINAYMTTTWVAREQGFFRKHSVEVEPVFIIATRAAQAMLAGEVHIGLIGPTHVTNAVVAGGDLVMFMGNQNNVRYIMVVHPSIKRGEDLKGKRIAIGEPGGSGFSRNARRPGPYGSKRAPGQHYAASGRRGTVAFGGAADGKCPGHAHCSGVGEHSDQSGIHRAPRYGEAQHSISGERHGNHAQGTPS